jgi:hypothetical protein|tara:strand:+ start:642 stop:926 length:285 start_codon:yes stop_codon:yes gene_type:complete
MPDKILSALSPAYGIATGTGPYRDLLGTVGRGIYDRAAEKRENKKRKEEKKLELDALRKEVEAGSYKPNAMFRGGRVKPVDGCAVKGKTKPPVF